jgi:hypothetical protein
MTREALQSRFDHEHALGALRLISWSALMPALILYYMYEELDEQPQSKCSMSHSGLKLCH